MKKLTDKQKAFVEGRAQGLGTKDAAIHAGYSATTAHVIGSTLAGRADIKSAIRAAKKNAGVVNEPETDDKPKLKASYKDSLEFFKDAMNNPRLADGVRFEAAKQLLPYEHARVAEKGKKESKKDDAVKVAAGQTGTPFRTKAPPKLRAVK